MKYTDQKTKKARIAYLKIKLSSNPAWAIKGVTRIFEYQTADEQNSDTTREHNNVGFTSADSYILSQFAKQINYGRFVGSKKQMDILFKKMPKYAGQLDKIAQSKVGEP